MNKRLRDLYVSKFSQGNPSFLQELREKRRNKNKTEHPSYPLLINIDEEKYHKSTIKIMVFGQETNTWERDIAVYLL